MSLAAHGDAGEAEGYVQQFEQQTGWRPTKIALFSGALLYTHYGFLKRHVMKKIAQDKPATSKTDTSRDYVYTEWDGVKHFAENSLADLPAEASRTTTKAACRKGGTRKCVPAESRCRGRPALRQAHWQPAADGLRTDHDIVGKEPVVTGGIRDSGVMLAQYMSSISATDR